MSLDNIQLPVIVLEQLFNKSLIELKTTELITARPGKEVINMLGENKKGVLILVNYNEVVFLPEDELNFLIGILSACKLSMQDAGIVNIDKNNSLTYETLENEITCNQIFMFGVSPQAIQLPLTFPFYQIQQYNNHTYLAAPDLTALLNDKVEKGKLWNSLKQIFSL